MTLAAVATPEQAQAQIDAVADAIDEWAVEDREGVRVVEVTKAAIRETDHQTGRYVYYLRLHPRVEIGGIVWAVTFDLPLASLRTPDTLIPAARQALDDALRRMVKEAKAPSSITEAPQGS